jgi:hypothetical protein
MKIRRHLSAGALALIVSLSISPVVFAVQPQRPGDEPEVRERIVRVIKKISKILHGVTTLDEYPVPPKP